MKKIYQSPTSDVIVLETKSNILNGSSDMQRLIVTSILLEDDTIEYGGEI